MRRLNGQEVNANTFRRGGQYDQEEEEKKSGGRDGRREDAGSINSKKSSVANAKCTRRKRAGENAFRSTGDVVVRRHRNSRSTTFFHD